MERSRTKRGMDFFSLYKNDDFLYKEKERLIIRWMITAVVIGVLYGSLNNDTEFFLVGSIALTAFYFIFNTFRFLNIKVNTKKAPSPRWISSFLYFDILILSLPLMVAPKAGGFLTPLLLFLVISAGLNYGHRIMIKCTTCVMFLFTIAVLVSPYWQKNTSVMLSVYVMMLVIPFYLMPIMKHLEINTIKLNEEAHKDSLTGLKNRTTLHSRIEKVLVNTKNNNKISALFYFDLDNFKSVNDQLGHKAGDALLAAVGKNLMKEFRNNDCIFRLGGDEFFIIAEGLSSKEGAEILGQKIFKAVNNAAQKTAPTIPVSSSIGVLCLTPSDINMESDIKSYVASADNAMYAAKKAGKSRMVFAK